MRGYAINPDIAKQAITVGAIMATATRVERGKVYRFAVIERVTYPYIIIENVDSHNVYSGAYAVDEALAVIEELYMEMP